MSMYNVQVSFSGKVIEKLDVKVISEKYSVQPFIVEVTPPDNERTQYFRVDASGNDMVEKMKDINEGDIVEVSANVDGYRFQREGKYLYGTSLKTRAVMKVDKEANGGSIPQDAPQDTSEDKGDDLPF